jgi:hypothetical protein
MADEDLGVGGTGRLCRAYHDHIIITITATTIMVIIIIIIIITATTTIIIIIIIALTPVLVSVRRRSSSWSRPSWRASRRRMSRCVLPLSNDLVLHTKGLHPIGGKDNQLARDGLSRQDCGDRNVASSSTAMCPPRCRWGIIIGRLWPHYQPRGW